MFQHTAARRRLPVPCLICTHFITVSTHSRPKAAASISLYRFYYQSLFQHTAARRRLLKLGDTSFNLLMFQHTAARRRLPGKKNDPALVDKFQHTAARRRLPLPFVGQKRMFLFQHTAARRRLLFLKNLCQRYRGSFNTQPPEGGCLHRTLWFAASTAVSTHSRPKAAAFN